MGLVYIYIFKFHVVDLYGVFAQVKYTSPMDPTVDGRNPAPPGMVKTL